MSISFATLSMLGGRSTNEDAVGCWRTPDGFVLACVADGLGGLGGGDIASSLAVSVFQRLSLRKASDLSSMRATATAAHQEIVEAQAARPNSRMATTLTCILLKEYKILGVHCGDSRAVLARGNGIKRLTSDHSEGQRLFEAGKLSKEELLGYPRKHILESALGVSGTPRIDVFEFDALPGDRLLLTTDGVHNVILLRELQKLCAASLSPEMLVRLVDETIMERSPRDNYSMVAVFI